MERPPAQFFRTNSAVSQSEDAPWVRGCYRQLSGGRSTASSRPSDLCSTLPVCPSPLCNEAHEDSDADDRRLSAFSMHLSRYDLSFKYVLGDALGAGVSATVYRATCAVTDEEVAIKVFKDATSAGTHAAATEYLCAMRAASPAALEYHSIAFMNGKPVLVMELAKMSLDRWIKTFTYSAAAEAQESEHGSSFSSFTSTSTPRSSCPLPQCANVDEPSPDTETPSPDTTPVVPSLLHALPAADDASRQPLGTYKMRSEAASKSSNLDMSAWQGDYPPLVEIMRVLTSILEGLMVMHEAGLAHCDLKPANIVLMPDGSTKLADFGAACAINSYTGRLATMHGSGLRDKEIERLMQNHMPHNKRTSEDHPSTFGSLWDILDQDNHIRHSSSAIGSGVGASCSDAHRDLDAINETQAGGAQDTWKVPEPSSSTSDAPISPFLLQQHSSQPVAGPSETITSEGPTALATHAENEEEKDDEYEELAEDLETEGMCKGREDYMRHTAAQSTLLRSFRSCPGSSQISSGPEAGDVKPDRRGVRWFSGAGGSSMARKPVQESHTADDNNRATCTSVGSRNSCSSPIKAYSLRDVPMFTSTYSSPERSNSADQRKVDVWATGCILYELCTGKSFMRPQRGGSIYTLMAQLHDPNWSAPEDCLPRCMACWRPMLNAMLCRDPALRPLPRELLGFDVLRTFRSQRSTSARGRTFNGNFSLTYRNPSQSVSERRHPLSRPSGISHAVAVQGTDDTEEDTIAELMTRFRASC